MLESWATCQGELLTGGDTNSRGRNRLQLSKLGGVGDGKSALTSDKEMQNLAFALLALGFTLVQCFPCSTPFENGNVYSVPLYVESM